VCGDIVTELVSHNRRLGAPEAGGDEDRVGFHPAFHELPWPGQWRVFKSGLRTSRPNLSKSRRMSLSAISGKEDLATHLVGCNIDLVLDTGIFRPAGELGDPYRGCHFFPPSPSRKPFYRRHELHALFLALRVIQVELRDILLAEEGT